MKMNKPEPVEPNSDQLRNAQSMGWEYLGDGLFSKGDLMGWFYVGGFWKE